MTAVVVRGGTVVDASGSRREDVVCEGGVVVATGAGIEVPRSADVLDAGDCFVLPGLVDLHCHLREPGAVESETLQSGARAAALGGYSAVVAMPNTDPAIDGPEVVRYVRSRSAGAPTEILCAGAITEGRAGERLAALGEMFDEGVRLFTDDGCGVQDSLLMRRAMQYVAGLGGTVAEHCEEARLAHGAHMHEGRVSSILGIAGMPVEAEEVMAARDIALARLTGCRLHLLHASSAGTVALAVAARSVGAPVTVEVTPHHLSLTDDEVRSFDPVFKVNPPLRSVEHVRALVAALVAGDVDAVATDHAPHPAEAKDRPFDEAPPGMLGLQTALAVVVTVLTSGTALSAGVDGLPVLAMEDAVALAVRTMSTCPSRIAGLDAPHGIVAPGGRADLCVFDPSASWVVDRHALASLATNSPYVGRKLTGRVRHTVLRGRAVVVDGESTP